MAPPPGSESAAADGERTSSPGCGAERSWGGARRGCSEVGFRVGCGWGEGCVCFAWRVRGSPFGLKPPAGAPSGAVKISGDL